MDVKLSQQKKLKIDQLNMYLSTETYSRGVKMQCKPFLKIFACILLVDQGCRKFWHLGHTQKCTFHKKTAKCKNAGYVGHKLQPRLVFPCKRTGLKVLPEGDHMKAIFTP